MRGLSEAEANVLRLIEPHTGCTCGTPHDVGPFSRSEVPTLIALIANGRAAVFHCLSWEPGHLRITQAGRTALMCHRALHSSMVAV
jgi:hypothetical protein